MVTFPFFTSKPYIQDFVGQFEGSCQRIVIGSTVLCHVHRYRQTRSWSKEAGGQLFGTVTPEVVRVTSAIGPHGADVRSRYAFRSEPYFAQLQINARFQRGDIYLGEWHTHAERVPTPSGTDFDAMSALLAASKLSTNALVLMIVGRAPFPEGLNLCTFSAKGVQQVRTSVNGSTETDMSDGIGTDE